MPENFSKSDFLTAPQVAQIFNIDIDTVRVIMMALLRHNVKIRVNNRDTDLVYAAKWLHRSRKETPSTMRLHPAGIEKFGEILAIYLKQNTDFKHLTISDITNLKNIFSKGR